MANKLGDFFNNIDGNFNSEKLSEVLNLTKDVAENVGKKSAERLEISKKRVECIDAKAKLNKLYEKFGKLQYAKYNGDFVSDDEINDCAAAISDNIDKVEFYTSEIEKAKAAFNESVSNMAKKTRNAFSRDSSSATEVESDAVDATEAKNPQEDAAEDK